MNTSTTERVSADDLSRPTATPETVYETITPEAAAALIEKNSRNRSVRPNTVNAYARVMEADGWMLTGEGIKFDTQGNLLDGQHRLLAIIRAGKPVRMAVTRGIDAEAQSVMDSGIKRSAQDFFLMSGVKNPANVSAIARLAIRLNGLKSPSNAEIIEWVDENPSVHTAAEVAASYRKNIDIHPSVLGVAWMNLSKLDLARAEEFYDSIASHRTEGDGDPRNTLIRRMSASRRTNERLKQEAALSLVYRAWNAWVTGEELHRLPIESRMGKIKIPDPVPFGTAPRPSRTRGRTVTPTPEDYASFDWPTPEPSDA